MENKPFTFEEEVRCDFTVDTQRKKIWKSELDMLALVDDICERHGLRYCAIGGTLLGAVRHKGYIPWDDDLDVAMFRDDYNKFLQVAEKEIGGRYFFQTTLTDRDYFKEHARIRDSETTGICERYERHPCNNGIFLDILPLDNYYDTPFGRLYSAFTRKFGRALYVKVHYHTRPANSIVGVLAYLLTLPLDLRWAYRLREKMQTRHSRKNSEYVGIQDMFFTVYKPSRLIWKRADFNSYTRVPFEHTTIPIPDGYDGILKAMYGDYMKFPKVEDRGKHHGIVFDPDTPYKDYIAAHYPAEK